MCMKCGCSVPNDKKVAAPIVALNGKSGKTVVVQSTDSTPSGYDYMNR